MSLLRKGVLVSGGQVLGAGLSMLAGILFARTLGPDGMGQVEVFRSTGTVAGVLLALGIGQASIYFLNNRGIPTAVLVTNTVKTVFVLGPVLAAGLAAGVLLMPNYFGTVPALVAAAFALGIACVLVTNLLRPVLVARLDARRMVAADLAIPLVTLMGGGLLVLVGGMAVGPALVVQAAASTAATVLVVAFLRREVRLELPYDWGLLRKMLVYGVKLAASNILYVLSYNITVMLLRYLTPERFDDVGLYTRAVAICGLVTLVPMAVGPLLYAKWSGLQGQERTRQAEMALRLNAAYGAVAAVGVYFLGRYIIWLLYGERFISAEVTLGFLAPALFLTPIFGVCNNLLASDGRAGLTAGILLGTLVISAAVTYAAAPVWGIRGAALAVLCANAFTAVGGMVACWRLYGLRPLHCVVPTRSDVRYVLAAFGWAEPPESAARRTKSGDDRLA